MVFNTKKVFLIVVVISVISYLFYILQIFENPESFLVNLNFKSNKTIIDYNNNNSNYKHRNNSNSFNYYNSSTSTTGYNNFNNSTIYNNNNNNNTIIYNNNNTQISSNNNNSSNNNFKLPEYSNKSIIIDIVIPFPESDIEITLDAFKRWDQPNKLPCDIWKLNDYYRNAQSNLVLYQNFKENKENEKRLLDAVQASKWSKCFNKVLFTYADNTIAEDEYPKGVTIMFYKYFKIGHQSDYFFWMEADVNPLKKDWLIELFRLTINTQEARGNKPFYIMGSNNRRPHMGQDTRPFNAYHINGNAIYWRDISWYNSFLKNVENWYRGYKFFDIDIFMYLEDASNWSIVSSIYQEFIFYEIIQNLAHEEYKEEDMLRDFPRTFFIHS